MARDPVERTPPESVSVGSLVTDSVLDAAALFPAGLSTGDRLARLAERDPLHLEARCGERVRERALLLEIERVWSRTMVRVVELWSTRGLPASFDAWLTERVDESINAVLAEDQDCVRQVTPRRATEEHPHGLLEDLLGLEPDAAAVASVAFHALPEPTRHTFIALLIENRPLTECVAAGLGSRTDLIARTRRALSALLNQAPLDDNGDPAAGGAP